MRGVLVRRSPNRGPTHGPPRVQNNLTPSSSQTRHIVAQIARVARVARKSTGVRPAGERDRVHGREVPDPGAGPDRADLPLSPGWPSAAPTTTSDTGTSPLFAALEIETRKGHRRGENPGTDTRSSWRSQAGRPRLPNDGTGERHRMMDNYVADKHAAVNAWLTENPRVICRFTSTHAS